MSEAWVVDIGEDHITITLDGMDVDVAIPGIGQIGMGPSRAQPHQYVKNHSIGLVEDFQNVDNIYKNLLEDPAPRSGFNWTEDPVINGEVSSIPILGSVTHWRNDDDHVVVNVTNGDHALYPGIVVRLPRIVDDRYVITTIGIGNGDLADVNEQLADVVWYPNAQEIGRETKFEENWGITEPINPPDVPILPAPPVSSSQPAPEEYTEYSGDDDAEQGWLGEAIGDFFGWVGDLFSSNDPPPSDPSTAPAPKIVTGEESAVTLHNDTGKQVTITSNAIINKKDGEVQFVTFENMADASELSIGNITTLANGGADVSLNASDPDNGQLKVETNTATTVRDVLPDGLDLAYYTGSCKVGTKGLNDQLSAPGNAKNAEATKRGEPGREGLTEDFQTALAKKVGAVEAGTGAVSEGDRAGVEAEKTESEEAEAVDPLVLDLDGDGLELTDFVSTGVLFDIDNDGIRERTGWVHPDDGILVHDLDGSGTIDGITETLSEYYASSGDALYADGFAALATLDGNGDGVFDAADTAYGNLRIWQDADWDGETDDAESWDLTDAADVAALGGNVSTLFGGKGDDILIGGRGQDVINGGWGKDMIRGHRGCEYLLGEKGDKTLFCGNGKRLSEPRHALRRSVESWGHRTPDEETDRGTRSRQTGPTNLYGDHYGI